MIRIASQHLAGIRRRRPEEGVNPKEKVKNARRR
jgi:hypothetical protein